MSKKKVYIRADADQKIGYGHFIRCLALANMLKDDFDCTFFTQTPSEYQRVEVLKVCSLVELPSDDSKLDSFLDILTGDEIVVLDNYFFTSEYQFVIKQKGCRIVTLGSNDRHYYADAIINFTNLKPEQFSVEPYTKICLGLNWTLLRPPFYIYKNVYRQSYTYAICIGGTDQFCYAEKFSSFIRQKNADAIITVIATDRIGEQRIDSLQKSGVKTAINQSAQQMASIFQQTEVAIVSASGVAVEALSQHANVITGYYVNNQVNIYNTFVEDNLVWPIGDFAENSVTALLSQAIDSIHAGEVKPHFNIEDTVTKYRQLFLSL